MATARDETGLNVTYACPSDVIRQLGTDALDDVERARAACMTNKARHQHFVAGRALLRHSLSAATGHTVEPAAWQFENGAYGKPSVIAHLPQVHFSISHTEGLVAVTTSPLVQVGIDLELVTRTGDTGPVLDQLTQREQAWLERHSDADHWPAFLQLWTAKEAMSKVMGIGCGVDFREIEIDVPAGCVRCPESLLDTGDHIGIDMRTVDTQDAKYYFSVACMQTAGPENIPSTGLLCDALH